MRFENSYLLIYNASGKIINKINLSNVARLTSNINCDKFLFVDDDVKVFKIKPFIYKLTGYFQNTTKICRALAIKVK